MRNRTSANTHRQFNLCERVNKARWLVDGIIQDCGSEKATQAFDLLSELFDEQFAKLTGPYTVGRVGHPGGEGWTPGKVLGRFSTEQDAAKFISGLEGHEQGIYYLDGPEKA